MSEFEKLLKEGKYDYKFEQGSIVKGKIIYLEKDGAYVDIGAKSEAFLPYKELTTFPRRGKIEESITIGEQHDFFILKEENEEGPTLLSIKKVNQAQGWNKLEEAKRSNETIKGKVASVVRGGLIVELFGIKGFVPSSQLRLKGNNLDSFLDADIAVKILELDPKTNKLILSQKIALLEEKADLREKTIQSLESGQTVKGEVVRVTDFGAFVDLGGIDGLLPVSEFSWQRINHPQEMLKVGQLIELMVLKVERDSGKISLSLKRMQTDPWQELSVQEGETIKGKVSKIASFGVFVQIEGHDHIEGLLPRSEITSESEAPEIEKYVKVGQEISVLVKRFIPKEHRLSLSLKDVNASKS